MNLPRPLKEARLVRRLNRFAAEVLVQGRSALAHVPNSGRLSELLVEGAQVYLHAASRPDRKTAYDLLLVRSAGRLVSIDSRAPAAVAGEALLAKGMPPAPRAEELQREVPVADVRIDLRLRSDDEEWLVETKGCTLVVDGTALFPDAPTIRGRRHVEALTAAASAGERAMVLFVVQRDDAFRFAPNAAADPGFAAALAAAADAGVHLAAYACDATLEHIALSHPLPMILSYPPSRRVKEFRQCG